MAKTAQTKIASKGTCNFCHDEFDKSKMTQHLKYCKQRVAATKQADAGSEQKERIFHLLVEGKYLPMYWMYLEMPAKATLLALDDFLRAIWVECCDHLSEFRIGKVSYTSSQPDFGDFAMFDAPTDVEGVIVEEDEEFEEDDEDNEDDEEDGLTVAEENELIKMMGKELVAEMSAAFPQGLTNVTVNDIIAKFADMALQNGNVSPDVLLLLSGKHRLKLLPNYSSQGCSNSLLRCKVLILSKTWTCGYVKS